MRLISPRPDGARLEIAFPAILPSRRGTRPVSPGPCRPAPGLPAPRSSRRSGELGTALSNRAVSGWFRRKRRLRSAAASSSMVPESAHENVDGGAERSGRRGRGAGLAHERFLPRAGAHPAGPLSRQSVRFGLRVRMDRGRGPSSMSPLLGQPAQDGRHRYNGRRHRSANGDRASAPCPTRLRRRGREDPPQQRAHESLDRNERWISDTSA